MEGNVSRNIWIWKKKKILNFKQKKEEVKRYKVEEMWRIIERKTRKREEEKTHRSEKNSRIFGTKKRTEMNTKNKQNFGEIARKVVSRLMLSYEGNTKMRKKREKKESWRRRRGYLSKFVRVEYSWNPVVAIASNNWTSLSVQDRFRLSL